MSFKLQKQLKELGSKLKSLPSSKDAILKLLKQAASYLSELEQSPSPFLLESLQPFFNVIAKPELLNHRDRDVKLMVATCICEITRITAPEAPYNDDVLREIFTLIVGTFRGLSDISGPSFGRHVVILDTLAKYRSYIVMLDLECYDLIEEMFSIFFSVIRADHPENVQVAMETIMVVLIEESEDIPEEILLVIMSYLGRDKKDTNSSARKLAVEVIKRTAGKLEPEVKQLLISSISGVQKFSGNLIDYHEVIYEIFQCAPNILLGVIPYLTRELLADQVDVRLKAVNLVGDLSAVPGSSIFEEFQPICSEFLKRLTDTVSEVRMVVLEHIRNCLLSNPSRSRAPQILSALCERLLDFDENVRKQVVSVICDVACHDLRSVPIETFKLVADRLQDKSALVRNYTMKRLAEVYKLDCSTVSDDAMNNEFDWIPGQILRCYDRKDFRSDTIESIISVSLFPPVFSVKSKVKHWIKVFAGFDKVEVKALEKMLDQKQRLQQEMQKYLSMRQASQSKDDSEYQKKVMACFKVMSRLLSYPLNLEELFQALDRIEDANIWGILKSLLDSHTSSHQACISMDELLKIVGEGNLLYDFLSALSVKLSYALFDKEHLHELLLEASEQKAAGNTQRVQSCMNILVILARYCPSLFKGIEKNLIILLKDDSEIIREGIMHVLANAGGTIKEQLAVSSSPIDLTLETMCLEGSRKQAKYAIQALAVITKDDGLMSLSVLYKKLVDMLDEKTHLPVVLQSLGCIAQTAVPVFETRETEIIDFLKNKILNCSSKVEDVDKTSWDERSELCSMKIFSIKALVKSYLPFKDSHLRPGIDDLIELLKNLLLYGEISEGIISSVVDKAHLKLASAKAILRLSRCWNENIPVDVFHLVVKSSEVKFIEFKKLFLRKVYQYLKERVLDGKYACAFVTNMAGLQTSEIEQNLRDVVEMYDPTKAQQLAGETDTTITLPYPVGILPYLIHVLSHHSLPNIDECKDPEAYEQTYRQLYFIISLLLHGYENKNERITAIKTIMLSIQSSEDAVDAAKSKNSHAICDLGISIIKRLAQNEDAVPEVTSSVTLPSVLYKPVSKTEGNPNEGVARTWLADESSLAHFNSLKLDTSSIDDPENEERDSEKANKISLGKIVKKLKSQGSRGKRERKKSPPTKSKSTELDVDVLNMVREINLENLELPSCGNGPSPSENKKFDKSSDKRMGPNGIDTTSVRVPKRRRSLTSAVTKSSNSKSSEKHPASEPKEYTPAEKMDSDSSDSGETLSAKKRKADFLDSDLLVSCLKNKKTSKLKSKTNGQDSNGRSVEKTDRSNTKMSADINVTDENDAKTPMGSSKKRKRRSVAVLAKCTAKYNERRPEDMCGCRIKVWWPLDEKFYEGVVKSYKKKTKEHEITYEDGDVETLSLHKERWEFVDSSPKTAKATSLSKKSKPSEKSSNQKSNNSKKGNTSIISSKQKSNGSKKGNTSKIAKPLILGLRAPTMRLRKDQGKGVGKSKTKAVDSDIKELLHDSDAEQAESSNSGDVDNVESEKDVDKMQEDEEAEVKKTDSCTEVDTGDKQVTEDAGNTTEPGERSKPNNEVEGDNPRSEDTTPSSPANPDASTSSKDPFKGDEEEDEPLTMWKQRVSKKSK